MEPQLLKHLRDLKEGKSQAFKTIYDIYHKKIAAFCLKNGQSQEDAKEVVQDIFMKLWLNRIEIDTEKNFEAYLYRIARNLIIDKFRQLSRERAARMYQIYVLTPENSTENNVLHNDLQVTINEIIESLPEMRRLVFHMSRIQELSNQEIAQELGLSVRTVENHIFKALQTFHEKLGHSKAI